MEKIDVLSPTHPGEVVETLYTPEEKLLATDLLKKLKKEKQSAGKS